MATNALADKNPVKTAAAPAAAAASALLLDRSIAGGDPNGTSAQADIMAGPFAGRALVLANAFGTSRYVGDSNNAGIILTLRAGGDSVADDSFEAQAHKLTFRAQASMMFVLAPGQSREVEASVTPLGAGSEARNRQTSVKLHVTAIAV
jgi:hypothetical protein